MARSLSKKRARTPRIRVPLPRQIGGRHEDKRLRPHRQRKHKKRDEP